VARGPPKSEEKAKQQKEFEGYKLDTLADRRKLFHGRYLLCALSDIEGSNETPGYIWPDTSTKKIC
jgi:hypothetical protein